MLIKARISSGFTGESGPDFEDGALPPSYEAAMEPYVREGSKSGPRICKNLGTLLRATIHPVNLSYWKKIFVSKDPIEASKVTVTGFHFDGDSNLPEINAVAEFELILREGVDTTIISELESDGETLGEAIDFYWDFQDNLLENWDGSLINNSGIEVSFDD